MTIKIKLKDGTVVRLNKDTAPISINNVDKTSIWLVKELNKNGDGVLTGDEIEIANESLNLTEEIRSLIDSPVGIFSINRTKRLKDKLGKLNAENVHAVLADFRYLTKKSNDTNADMYKRGMRNRYDAYSKLTLTQAIVNASFINAEDKRECLNKIVDAVAEASKENTQINDKTRQKCIIYLKRHIESMKFKSNTNTDAINALINELLPNDGEMPEHNAIISRYPI